MGCCARATPSTPATTPAAAPAVRVATEAPQEKSWRSRGPSRKDDSAVAVVEVKADDRGLQPELHDKCVHTPTSAAPLLYEPQDRAWHPDVQAGGMATKTAQLAPAGRHADRGAAAAADSSLARALRNFAETEQPTIETAPAPRNQAWAADERAASRGAAAAPPPGMGLPGRIGEEVEDSLVAIDPAPPDPQLLLRELDDDLSQRASDPAIASSSDCSYFEEARPTGANRTAHCRASRGAALQISPSAVHGKQFTWVRGQGLGKGSLGRVFCALDQVSGQQIAVKEVLLDPSDKDDMSFRASLEHEISILKDLKHPRIVSYLGHDYIEGLLYIYLEYMPGGSLSQVLGQFGPLEESTMAMYMRELVEGLEYLHTRDPPVLHRDIKGANVLVGLDCKVKLADFGCSKRHAELAGCSMKEQSMKGSIPWMAPEVVMQTGYGRSADIWSLGCVGIEMATAHQPWGHFDNPVAACFHIGMSQSTPPVPEALSPICRDFLASCLQRQPSLRPSASQLLLHHFVAHLQDAVEQVWS